MSTSNPASPVDALVGEARAQREALHDLIDKVRREQATWDHDAATLPRRARLTPSQRQRFRVHLLELTQRRVR